MTKKEGWQLQLNNWQPQKDISLTLVGYYAILRNIVDLCEHKLNAKRLGEERNRAGASQVAAAGCGLLFR
jgi:hypothetical protein